MLEYLSVGYVLKPQGIKGEIKVEPLTDNMERFDTLKQVFIEENSGYKAVKIKSRRYRNNFVYLKLEGFDSIGDAERLRNQYLWIPRSMAVPLPEDTYFIADIVGCRVETLDGRELGRVDHVIQTGSNDVYAVKGSMGEILIPALKKVIQEVDVIEGKIVVDAAYLEGLLPDED